MPKKYIVLWTYSVNNIVDVQETVAYGPYDTEEEAIEISNIIGTQVAEMVQADPNNKDVTINGEPVNDNPADDLEDAKKFSIALDVVELFEF